MSIKSYDGADWVNLSGFKRYSGSEWQTAVLKRYDGSAWETLWPVNATETLEYSLSGIANYQAYGTVRQKTDVLSVGSYNCQTSNANDTLLFFPLAQMRQDMAGRTLVSVELRLMRQTVRHGSSNAKFPIGYALSGVDWTQAGGSWSRAYTRATGVSHYSLKRGQAAYLPLINAAAEALLDGSADCLCLVGTQPYCITSEGYGLFYYDQTRLRLTYAV